jgi:hypothetical protein
MAKNPRKCAGRKSAVFGLEEIGQVLILILVSPVVEFIKFTVEEILP